MIAWEFGSADLAGLRFAHSPLAEVVASAFVLRNGGHGGLQASWRSRVLASLPRWPTFRAVLFGPHGHSPDFLTPPPRTARPTLAEELAAMAASPLDEVAAQVSAAWAGHDQPPEIRDPRTLLALLVPEIRAYFEVAIVPLWPRLRAAADAEIAGAARTMADHSARAMMARLHPKLDWTGSALLLRYPGKQGQWTLDGHHLTLLPTGFAGAEVFAMPDSPAGRTLWYAPGGHGNIWLPTAPNAPLAALLGPSRAAVLALVSAPYSTGEVAHQLGLAAGTASYHLTTLRDTGLVTAVRAGRRLLYQRTALGDQLVQDSRLTTPARRSPAGSA
ncbi:ArsR/SmtB family transcription factor [Actinoplanes derwentensis]|uniref:Helix-turn-helix domain-containing protein n=1 Tax=Actinoplanes derwentensis TaxID=113562 RepID=A0A1H1RW96_9ACTN|nr:winged helix-turn-helix domain-containing protein [Actinoplanes derwentensis]GID84539.1 putative regulatory protein [Actinoplanes derwentensis]SDS40007.1 Helix-turn-helix domain-containing protein [Actinoplanes derwentensis]